MAPSPMPRRWWTLPESTGPIDQERVRRVAHSAESGDDVSDDPVFAALSESLIVLDEQRVLDLTQQALDAGVEPIAIINDGLTPGMNEVGKRFESGDYFLPELLIAADVFKSAVAIVKPHLTEVVVTKGKVVLGTVEGDIHDIGKNIVALVLETNGYEVIDLGIDVPVERFAEEQLASGAHIVGASAMITSTLPALRRMVVDVKAKCPGAKVLIGGAPVTPALVAEYGSDAYAGDAIEAVRVADELLL
jgi:methanogenic corrinoid protein MtbC1